MHVTVVGAGAIGLTSAIRLREAGHQADIVAADAPEATVASAQAGAIWYPYRTSLDRRAASWGARTRAVLLEEADADVPGLSAAEMIELLPRSAPDPWWADDTMGFRRPNGWELRPGFADGWMIQTVVIDVIPYLRYLTRRFTALGGTLEERRLESLEEVRSAGHLVVNCAGVGARHLVPDREVVPIRGQTVRVRGPRVERVTMVERGPLAFAYVMPRGDECVLGGTADVGDWDRTVDGATTREIMRKAAVLEPVLADAEIVEVRVGLRPGRTVVRLEREPQVNGAVIHNYGHSGNGWSLSWGCAEEVVDMVAGLAE